MIEVIDALQLYAAAVSHGIDPIRRGQLSWREAVVRATNLLARVVEGSEAVAFIDAGSVGYGEVAALRLAILLLRGKAEEVLYPATELQQPTGRSFAPITVLRVSSKLARQAATYVLELAAALALARGVTVHRGASREEVRASVVVKHGPLLHAVGGYVRALLPRDTVRHLLLHSGLDEGATSELLELAEVGGGRVSLGLLAAAILRELAASSSLVAGVVEDTTSSRVASTRIAAELVANVKAVNRGGGDGSVDWECVEVDSSSIRDVVDLLDKLVGATEAGSVAEIEAALAKKASSLLPTDNELLLAIHYAEGLEAATGELTREAPGVELVAAASRVAEELGVELPVDLAEARKAVRASVRYVMPPGLPTCSMLREAAGRVNRVAGRELVEAEELAGVIETPPPIRVEVPYGADSATATALVAVEAAVAVYGYPHHLLKVDYYSRVPVSATIGLLERLVEELASRMQPYTPLPRSWLRRRSAVSY